MELVRTELQTTRQVMKIWVYVEMVVCLTPMISSVGQLEPV